MASFPLCSFHMASSRSFLHSRQKHGAYRQDHNAEQGRNDHAARRKFFIIRILHRKDGGDRRARACFQQQHHACSHPGKSRMQKNSAKHTAGISSMRIPTTDKMRRSQSICARLLPAIIIPVIIMESGVFIFPISASGCVRSPPAQESGTGRSPVRSPRQSAPDLCRLCGRPLSAPPFL